MVIRDRSCPSLFTLLHDLVCLSLPLPNDELFYFPVLPEIVRQNSDHPPLIDVDCGQLTLRKPAPGAPIPSLT